MAAKQPWFRVLTTDRMDPVIEALSDADYRIYMRLLSLASEQEEAYTLLVDDVELLAVHAARGDVDALQALLDKLARWRKISLADGVLAFIEYRELLQPKRPPSADPEQVRARVAAHRERKREETGAGNECNEAVTSGNEPVTALREEKSREEKSREEKTETREGITPGMETVQEPAGAPAPVPPDEEILPTLPKVLRGERFPLLRELCLWTRRTYGRDMDTALAWEQRLDRIEAYEAQLRELAEISPPAWSRTWLAMVSTQAIKPHWAPRLENRQTTNTLAPHVMGIVAELIRDGGEILAKRKGGNHGSTGNTGNPPAHNARIEAFERFVAGQQPGGG